MRPLPRAFDRYGSRYRQFKARLEERLAANAGSVHWSSEATPGATGAFEVTVDGQLLHSKMKTGESAR